jgi:hypothetical protein
MMPSVVVLHPLQLLPGGISPGHTSPKALPGSTFLSKAEYTNTQQDIPVGDHYFTILDMKGFWPLSFFSLKSNKEYVLTSLVGMW